MKYLILLILLTSCLSKTHDSDVFTVEVALLSKSKPGMTLYTLVSKEDKVKIQFYSEEHYITGQQLTLRPPCTLSTEKESSTQLRTLRTNAK